MARKGIVEAEAEIRRAHETRLQYLSRNPEFRQLIESVISLRESLPGKPSELTPERAKVLGGFIAKLEQAGREWGVSWALLNQLSFPDWHADLDHKERIPAASFHSDRPVSAWTEASSASQAIALPPSLVWADEAGEDTRYLNLLVDLDHP